ncbi:MAG: acyl-CoA dehydrogenase [Francisellaceae bacterium]|nr:acyl-CoA dehydrogenase [Francisellaceae bacterium]
MLNLNEQQLQILQAVNKFALKEIAPYADKWSQDKVFPVQTFKKAASIGLAGLNVSSNHGGMELDRYSTHLIFIELAKFCPCFSAYLSIHNMVAWATDSYGSSKVKEKYLTKLCSMEILSSYCLTEPGSGSDAASLKTIASLNNDGASYTLNGQKAFISGAPDSDLYLCMTKVNENITAFLVDKKSPGISFGAQEKKMGWRSQSTASVHLDACVVPKENMIGEIGQGFKIAMSALDKGRISIGACSIGGAQYCLEKTIAYMSERKQFDKPLKDFQALQFKIANMTIELECAKQLLSQAAMSVDQNSDNTTLLCAMAKKKATDVGFMVVNEAMQIHGGYGYLEDYQIERYLRDLRVHQILEGTNEIMQLIIARKILS